MNDRNREEQLLTNEQQPVGLTPSGPIGALLAGAFLAALLACQPGEILFTQGENQGTGSSDRGDAGSGDQPGSEPIECAECADCPDVACDVDSDCPPCVAACSQCPRCGDGTCEGDEGCTSCPEDCGACSTGDPWSFLIISDTRSNMTRWGTATGSMAELDPDAIALFDVGDIVANGTAEQWQESQDTMAMNAPDPLGVHDSIFRTDLSDWDPDYIRFVGVLGNHDVDAGEWRDNWAQYLPGQSSLGMGGQVFHLTYDNALFIVLDSSHGDVGVDEQAAWLEGVLQSPEGQAATWKFVFFHKPVYPCRSDKSPFSKGLAFVSILEQEGVDMAFVGDSHSFERTCPMKGGTCQPGGVIYMNTASAGASSKAPTLSLVRTVDSGNREDTYTCADILDPANGGDHYPDEDSSWFCRAAIDGAQMELLCYFHDDTSLPYTTLTITK